MRLVFAEDAETARQKAKTIGQEEQHDYYNENGARVSWRFSHVVEIQDLCEPEIYDGIEVYSRLSWKDQASS